MRVQGLSKEYVQRRWLSRRQFLIPALVDVCLDIWPGTTFALVGESGSGKSTLARCLVRLEEPTGGEIWFEGRNLTALSSRALVEVRQQIQLIFQDSASGLNPRLTALEIISEPLAIQRRGTKKERDQRAMELMECVGLWPQWSNRTPLEFSGGQRQRMAIARALSLRPRFLILDEALAGLDLSIQAQIVNLLRKLQVEHSLTYFYISHDLSLVGQIAEEVAVMHRGRIVEQAITSSLFAEPRTPYTRGLLASIPRV